MKGRKILIVDDEKEICFLLSALLKQMGYLPDQAFTIEEAMGKLKKHSYDLFFLDLNLPDGLGYHLAPMIKQYHQISRIVMISAHDGMLKQIQSEVEGIDHFIDKPFNKEKINEALIKLNMYNYSSS
jgi:DNA-binding response OmpR family regulator